MMGLSRLEAYSKWGLIREIEPLTQAAYEFFEWLEQQKPNIGENASHPWHTSWHGSRFPGRDPYACGRRAIYQMMDIPRSAFSRTSRAIMEAGKDIENRLVLKWYLAGYLLSFPPPPFGDKQMEFIDPSTRLSSTVDAILLHPKQNKPKVVEVKTKYADEIELMLRLCRGPDPYHINQLLCQIGLAHEQQGWHIRRCYNSGRLPVLLGERNGRPVEVCPEHGTQKCLDEVELEPVDTGHLYYVSRDKPDDTWEFLYEYDPEFMAAGRRQLDDWNEHWQSGVLPQTNFEDKKFAHPFGWTWTKSKKHPDSPCQYCEYGDICREDTKLAIKKNGKINLEDSAGIEVAEEIRNDYSLDLIRKAVEARWS